MKVSVVIPTYNRPGLALNLARQIRKHAAGAEIIIVDQSEKKEDPQKIRESSLKYILNSRVNTSIAKNIGFKETTGDIVLFFDDDVEITPTTIKAHLEEYGDRGVLGVAGRVINDGEPIPSKTNIETGRTNKYLTAFTGNFWGTSEQTVQFPYGCNMSFRRTIFEEFGGFDQKILPPGFEEYDLGLRITRLGKMVFSPEALVFHHKAPSGGTRINKDIWFRNYYWNYGRLIRRHVPFPHLLISIIHLKLRILREYPPAIIPFLKGLLLYENYK